MDDLCVDFSKEHIDAAALDALFSLAQANNIAKKRHEMFSAGLINTTQNRAALHVALRDSINSDITAQGKNIANDVKNMRDKFLAFAENIRSGAYAAADGQPFSNVVNIGIGGSELGPHMAVCALKPDARGPKIHFIANIDGAHIQDILSQLDPKNTLIIISSKSFTTLETITNAHTAKAWLEKTLGKDTKQHLVAISSNIKAASVFGIAPENIFTIWDWVGGRYSIWSSTGLPLAIAIGARCYRQFLQGASDMDNHFQQAPMRHNLPILLALIGIWRRNIRGCQSIAIIPYDQRLVHLPNYLQQLDMESNGKSVTSDGVKIHHKTAPIIWGSPGTNCQHSFFQIIHQGTDIIPVDFIINAQARDGIDDHHTLLLANCLAQSQALSFGKDEHQLRKEMVLKNISSDKINALVPHLISPGNRPSTIILQKEINPYTLGRLIALYEHKVFVQGVLWGINSFDQWGVELGKELAHPFAHALRQNQNTSIKDNNLDSSMSVLLKKIIQLRKTNNK